MGRSIPGGAPFVQHSPAEFGAGTAAAIADVGGDIAEMARTEMAEQRRKDEQERSQAERLKAFLAGAEGEADLNRTARELADGVISGQMDEAQAEKEWASRSQDILSTRTSDLGPRLGPTVGAELKVAGTRMRDNVLTKAYRERTRSDVKAGLVSALEVAERNALANRPQAVEHVQRMVAEMGGTAGLGADDQVRLVQGFRERTAVNSARALLRGASATVQGLDAFEARLQGDEFADLSPDARNQIDGQIVNRRAQLEHARQVAENKAAAAAERRMREAEDSARGLQMLVDGGALPSEVYLTDVQRKTAGTPYAAAVSAMVAQSAEHAGFGSLPPDQQQAAILRVRAQATAQGSSPAIEKRISQMQGIANAASERAEKDPLLWGTSTRLLDEVQPLQFGSIDQLAQQLGARVEQANLVAGALKRPVSPLLASEAQQTAELLRVLPVAQQSGALKLLAATLPAEQIRALSKQMGDRDQALSLAMFASVQPNPAGADLPALILRGADAERHGRLKDDPQAKRNEAAIAHELGRVPWPTPQARDAAVAAARLAYAGLSDAKKGSMADWREAVRVSNGVLVDHAGQKVPAPPGWTARRFETALRNTDAVTLAGQMLGPVFVGATEIRPEVLAKALPTATLIPMGPGRYAIDAGGVVMQRDRRPFIFTLRD